MTEVLSETYWLQNLTESVSTFTGAAGKFRMEPTGYVGSVVEVDRKIAFDPYIRRAIDRRKIGQLEPAEAIELMEVLQIKEEINPANAILEVLDKDASEKVGRYRREDLPDDAESRRPISAAETWSQGGTETKSTGPRRVARSEAPAEPAADAGAPRVVITERVRQGDWEPDLG